MKTALTGKDTAFSRQSSVVSRQSSVVSQLYHLLTNSVNYTVVFLSNYFPNRRFIFSFSDTGPVSPFSIYSAVAKNCPCACKSDAVRLASSGAFVRKKEVT
jgi:hypothetical protein